MTMTWKSGVTIALVFLTPTFMACPGDKGSCRGEATVCQLLGNECVTQVGCVVDGCGGQAASCDSIYDQTNCDGQQGCQWTWTECSGELNPDCYSLQDVITCHTYTHCYWSTAGSCQYHELECWDFPIEGCEFYNDCYYSAGVCEGIARTCFTITLSDPCIAHLGCELECSGTTQPCSAFTTASSCNQQAGCQWAD